MPKKILIVDDNEEHLVLVEAFIRDACPAFIAEIYNPLELGMPADDFAWHEYDLLLLDYNLRTSTGFEWLKKYKNAPGFPPVVIVTAESDEELAIRAIKLGAINYLKKERMSPQLLARTIYDAVEGSGDYQALSSDTTQKKGTGHYRMGKVHPVEARNFPQQQEIETSASDKQRLIKDLSDSGFTRGWPFTLQDILDGSARIGSYRIEGYVGKGGMATVFRTSHVQFNRPLVLKLLSGEVTDDHVIVKRFMKEFEISEGIDHPNIIKVYSQGFTDNHAYMILEYLPYGDLRKYIRHQIKPALAIRYATQVGMALVELHTAGIIHRDLKPANILLRDMNTAVVADFGVAKELVRKDSGLTLTESGIMIGTLDYASPERIQAKSVDHRTDQYSLGLILIEMLTGKKVVQGRTPVDVAMKHVTMPIPILPDEYSLIQPLIHRLLAKQPADRYEASEDMVSELEKLSAHF